jgi:cytochrome b6-f complex iron-sulfur subunit
MSEKISRRNFLKTSALGILAGSAALSLLDLEKLTAATKRGTYHRISGEDILVKLSDEKNAPLKKVNGAIFLDDEDMLIRISQTQFTALNLICRHKGCTVEYNGEKFVCPCHGSQYSADGTVIHGPAQKNLRMYETVYDKDKGTILVKMSKLIDAN